MWQLECGSEPCAAGTAVRPSDERGPADRLREVRRTMPHLPIHEILQDLLLPLETFTPCGTPGR